MIMKTKTAVRAFVMALLPVCAVAGSAAAEDIEEGRELAEAMCHSCHAIGTSDRSANDAAPSFREIAGRYSIWSLQEALAEGILVGHPDMPEFALAPAEINALLSYWDTLTPRKGHD